MQDNSKIPRERTKMLYVGDIAVGGGAPVVVQSMLATPTSDVNACLSAINALQQAGCELVRLAIPNSTALPAFEEICSRSTLPVIADIHFDSALACEACKRGAAKIRINPGNIGGLHKLDAVIEAAATAPSANNKVKHTDENIHIIPAAAKVATAKKVERFAKDNNLILNAKTTAQTNSFKPSGIPIRIGVNAGSLAAKIANSENLSLPQKLVKSAMEYVQFCENAGFTNIIVSAKAHDVSQTIATYKMLSKELPHVPLHLGVTEAGTFLQGSVKSSIGIGTLLMQGIGDTFRVSLTADPLDEVRVAWEILAACGLRRQGPELVSCPTCARCEVDMLGMAKELEQALLNIKKPLTVALMGCVVNGPGEARAADIGAACGKGKGAIFAHGEVLYTVNEQEIIPALLKEITRCL
ncbi:MAG: (E)-4-hydroxy-3-methylbut-2-enyl-diphosphate synthase [Coriobacteriales bacterium]|jgi:(E)-4-hydroxy-3-methylbut-2-enyl-diphosphate synthase|nr:(E)-4-hydroxy-3-methylbut-2-enyl-diphosphate synthase [Coriobacteriales bacterium]